MGGGDGQIPMQVPGLQARVDKSQGHRHAKLLPAVSVEEDFDVAAGRKQVKVGHRMSDRLFDDVKAAEVVSRSLAIDHTRSTRDVAAAERGRRQRPDGTIEDYERVEFRARES